MEKNVEYIFGEEETWHKLFKMVSSSSLLISLCRDSEFKIVLTHYNTKY